MLAGGGDTPPVEDDEGTGCPIVLNPTDGPWRLTGTHDGVLFDIDADGRPERMGWTERGARLAFLALDLNDNEQIDDGSELFGIGTLLPDGKRARNGFEALTEFDSNRDRIIDTDDPIWNSLLLWTDLDHDGVSQKRELRRIARSEITALELDH